MLGSSNPVFNNMNEQVQRGGIGTAQRGGQGGFGQQGGAQGFAQGQQFAQQAAFRQGYEQTDYQQQATAGERPMTIDDVVTKSALTLGLIVVLGAVSYFLSTNNPGLAIPLLAIGGIGGFITVLVATFGKKMGSAPVTLIYAAFEGLFVGAFSLVVPSAYGVAGVEIPTLIFQAIIASIAVFAGMLFVYKTGAIRVTPRFTRFMTAAIIGVALMALVNFVAAIFFDFNPLRDGGPIAIIFSLVCIGLAAFSFLMDFDNADKLVRAGAPAKMAWGVALGLAVTIVWLYTEILRLLAIFNND